MLTKQQCGGSLRSWKETWLTGSVRQDIILKHRLLCRELKARILLFSHICRHAAWQPSVCFLLKTCMQHTWESLWCFPTVLLQLEVLTHAQITAVIAFPAVSTQCNLSLHPFNYTSVCHTWQLHLQLTARHTLTQLKPNLKSTFLLVFWLTSMSSAISEIYYSYYTCRILFI